MNVVIVNGKRYETAGGSISVVNNKVYCNGKLLIDCEEISEKNIHITVEGNVDGNIETASGNITVKGSCRSVNTTSGNVECEDVSGDVKTVSGDVRCKNVGGSIKTVSGDISRSLFR